MPESVDPKGLVYQGQAGTGAAFILPDAWKFPLAMADRYAREDAAAAQRAAALRARQQADQRKANDKNLADLLSVDTSKAWDIDQPAIRDKYQQLIQYAAQSEAAGKPVGDARNTEQWARAQQLRKDIADAASASTQQQARWAEGAKVIENDKDGAYDRDRFMADFAAAKALPFDQRAGLDVNLRHYFNPGKAINAIHDKVDQEKRVQTEFTGRENTTRTTTDEAYNGKQHALMAQELLKMPGAADYVKSEYDKLTPAQRALPGNRSFDSFAQNWAESLSRQAEGQKHESQLHYASQWHGFAPRAKSAAELASESKRLGATTAVNQAVQLLSGDPRLFTRSSPDYPGLHEATITDKVPTGKFNYTTHDKQGNTVQHTADNFIEKVYRDFDTGKTLVLTTEGRLNGTGPVEVNEANGLRNFIYPLAGSKDQDVVNQVLAEKGLYGPNGLQLAGVRGTGIDPQAVQTRQQQARQYRAATEQAQGTLQQLVAGGALDDKSSFTTTGDSPRPAVAQKINQVLAGGTLRYNGRELEDARLEVGDKAGALWGYKAGSVRLRYKGDDGVGQVIKPADVPALLKGFRPRVPDDTAPATPLSTSRSGSKDVQRTSAGSSKSTKKRTSSSAANPLNF